jgi:dihydroorotate dehydrogenase electron transfer subunit
MIGDFETLVLSNRQLTKDIRDIWLQLPECGVFPKPGQFAHIAAEGVFLRRPISIAGFDKKRAAIRILVREAGNGTRTISGVLPGETVKALLPLGNPFPLENLPGRQKIWLVAGGIGAAPLLGAAKFLAGLETDGKKIAGLVSYLGFRDADSVFGVEEFEETGKIFLSVGGFVTEKISESLETDKPDMILACGPTPMLAALQKICGPRGIRAYASLEERMGCGVGACLVCSCLVGSGRPGEGAEYKRVCRDGPVFDLMKAVFQ